MTAYRIEPLAKSHDRTQFDCGVEALNSYLARQAGQDVRKRVAACFVAIDTESEQLAGYYTLSAGSIMLHDLPEPTGKKLPRYPEVPIARVGRLAVSLDHRGRKLGGVLLFDALKRAMTADVAAFAAVVDAKDQKAVQFYEHFGFQSLTNTPQTLFLPFSGALEKLVG